MPAVTPSLTIRTNFTPPITLNPISKSDAKGVSKTLFALFQPAIDGELPIVGRIHYAPNGEPTQMGVLFFAVVLLLAIYGAYKLWR